ncbi:unnamed protein product, partial [Amoebophrya sp. A120]
GCARAGQAPSLPAAGGAPGSRVEVLREVNESSRATGARELSQRRKIYRTRTDAGAKIPTGRPARRGAAGGWMHQG